MKPTNGHRESHRRQTKQQFEKKDGEDKGRFNNSGGERSLQGDCQKQQVEKKDGEDKDRLNNFGGERALQGDRRSNRQRSRTARTSSTTLEKNPLYKDYDASE